ncbi:PAS domain S-box protein [Devosia sp. RR2S18]|uniref:PAS domain S-box protein n=1 Tax=Devosia rhizosphaerae TaxID=3049774 RepID=UPI00253FCDDF|nr:PAS domain S-box protein [Devosia sp. RR2S18]WIJ24822.1 PAS domain S-box protein [Devosia sp. RR2S18]
MSESIDGSAGGPLAAAGAGAKALLYSIDWATHDLGDPADWPITLQSYLHLILAARQPMFIAWGPHLTFLYNDAYAPILGKKHPAAMGRPFPHVWSDIWEQIGPIVERTLAGEGSWYENLLIPMQRKGYLEEAWFSFSYTPIYDGSEIVGMICAATETTETVLAARTHQFHLDLEAQLRELSDPADIIATAQRALGEYLQVSRVGYGEVEESERYFTTANNWTNGSVGHHNGTHDLAGFGPEVHAALKRGDALVVRDVTTDPRTATPEIIAAFSAIEMATAITASLIKNERMIAALYVHDHRPRNWSDEQVKLVQDVAERTWSAVERARAQAAQKSAEQRIADVLESMGEAFLLLDADFRIVEINPEGLRSDGRSRGEVLGRSHWEVWPGSEETELGRAYKQAFASQQPASLEHCYEWPDGRMAWFEIRAYPATDGLALFYRDITQQRAVRDALRASEERLRDITDAVPILLSYVDAEQRFRFVNKPYETWFNRPREQLLGARLVDVMGEEVFSARRPYVERALAGETVHYDIDMPRPEGAVHTTILHIPHRNEEGEVDGFYAVVQDISDRKRTEDALRQSEDRFRKLTELSPAIVWFGNQDGTLSYINERWSEFSGQALDEALPDGWIEIIHPEDRDALLATWNNARQRGDLYEIEARLRRRDGSYRWFLIRAQPIVSEVDGQVSWLGLNADINDMVAAREELSRSRSALEDANRELHANVQARTRDHDRLWRISQELMLVADYEGIITSVNPTAKRLLNWDEHEMVGRSIAEFIHPEDIASTAAEVGKLGQGQTTLAFENRYRHRDGSYRTLSWTAVPYEEHIHAVARDVTDEKDAREALRQTEEALRQAQKMEAVGQLTGGIAHDFNNLLQGIVGSLDIAQRRIAQGRTGEVDRFLSAATTTANRAAALTHRLLAFSRRQPLDPRPVKSNHLVSQMEDLLRRTMGENIELEMVLAGGLWTTRCDPHQLESAILNLAINARDAMPMGGKLTIETCNAHLDNAYAARDREVKPGQYVCICVTDTGTGMSADTIAKAFEPFFTTKPIGQGTGLGLSMIYGFARQSEGYAKIYSEVGTGTTVKLYLPRFYGEGEDAEDLPLLTEEHQSHAGETVLVIEDESVVRDLVVEVLTELGYTAIEASEGPSGLAILQSKRKIDLLITDIGLPGLNGRQVADAARQQRPELRILFMTGYAENATLASGFLEPGMQMITKPFPMETLASRIREMIEG